MLTYSIVSRNDEVYECFPDLLLTKSGRLLCTYRESESHRGSRFSRLILRESADQGHTWGERRVLVTGPETDDDMDPNYARWNCPRLSQLSDGRIALICDFSNEWVPGKRAEARVHLWWSDDDGETWSKAQEAVIRGIVPDKICELEDGTLIIGTHEKDAQGTYHEYCWRSQDGGETWHGPIEIASDANYKHCEGSILRLPGGELVCYMRENSGRGDPGFKCISKDGGRTWEGPYPTLMEGCHRPVSGLLAGGRVLITYRFRVGGAYGGHENFFCYLETVESALEPERAKQKGRILALDHDFHPQPDTGYSGWVQFPDGDILAVYYIKGPADMAFIRGVRFRESDVCSAWR